MPRPRRVTPPNQGDAPAPQRWSAVLRALREASGVTQDGWAAQLGYSRATVQRWERGEAVPAADAEAALIAVCREKGLLRAYSRGPLGGLTVTPDLLRDLLAEGRAGGDPATPATAALPENVTRLFGRLRERVRSPESGVRSPTASASEFPTNLPAARTSFIGREQELAGVRQLTETSRLLTLTGAGGIGKTRLALQAAGTLPAPPPDGVWLVELDALSDPALITAAAATALSVREQPGAPLLDTLSGALREQQLLLILDNCEHLLAAAGRFAAALLAACPDVRILATSREPLGLPAETVWRVPAMGVPGSTFHVPRGQATDVERGTWNLELERSDAVRLFAERARVVLPTFALTEANTAVVAAICRRLDGIPLAIELAAARVRILAPEQIAARLDERFRLLTGGSAEALPRQQTLRAALDWSHDLLTGPERILLRRLAVFAGGCDVEAVETVCGGDGLEADEVVDLLTYLADKSLLVVEHDGQTARYRLLESVRAYALVRLDAAGEQAAVQARHAAKYLAVANAADATFMGPGQPASLARLDRDVDNLRAALTFARETGQADLAGELATRLWRFWYLTGRATEGRARLVEIIAATPPEPAEPRARLLDAAATLAHSQGDYAAARRALEQSLAVWRPAHNIAGIAGAAGTLALVCKAEGDLEGATALLEEALDLWRETGHEARVAVTLNNLSAVAIDRGTYAEAERYQEESLAIKRRAGDQHGIATSLHNLAECARYRGDFAHATELLEESIALSRALGIRQQTAQSLHSLGIVAHHLGDPARAAALLGEGLALYQSLDLPQGIALCLDGLAEVAAASDAERSVRLYGAADALREAIGAVLPPADAAVRERDLAACRAVLGDAAFGAAWARGRALTVEQAVGAGLGVPSAYRSGGRR